MRALDDQAHAHHDDDDDDDGRAHRDDDDGMPRAWNAGVSAYPVAGYSR